MSDTQLRRHHLRRIVALVADAPPDERRRRLDRLCSGRETLRQEVERLLVYEHASLVVRVPIPEDGSTDDPSTPPGSTDDVRPGATVGPYTLDRRLGVGGMGEIWLARQTHPIRREVALKIIRWGMSTSEIIGRFEAERQALALMDHPNIARILDAGATSSGRPYFAMEYVSGVRITEYADTHRLDVAERLRLFQQVCAGVQHAHQKALIHRDLKPGNVLVTEVDGRPVAKIIDFGVVKAIVERLTEEEMLTQHGVLIGTPEYMSPEQAALGGTGIDTRTDIYSLGVILYELLVGVLPFDPTELRTAGLESVRRIVREREPERPSARFASMGSERADIAARRRTDARRLRSELEGDLDWIVMRALDKDPNRRYATPQDLARDIQRHLDHEPVDAGPPAAAYRFGKLIRKHRVSGGIAAAAAVVLLGFALTMGIYAQRLKQERDRTRANELTAIGRTFVDGDPTSAAAFAVAALEMSDQPNARRLLRQALARGSLHRSIARVQDARNPFTMDVSPDGRTLAIGWTRLGAIGLYPITDAPDPLERTAVASRDRTSSRLVVSSELRVILTEMTLVNDLVFSADGAHLVASGLDSTVRVFRLTDDAEIVRTKAGGIAKLYPRDVPDKVMVLAHIDGRRRWWELTVPSGEVRDLGFSPGTAKKLDTHGAIHTPGSTADPRGRWVAQATERTIQLLDVTDLSGRVREIGRHDAEVVSMSFDPRGELLASCDAAGTINIWDLRQDVPRLLRRLEHGGEGSFEARFDPYRPRVFTFVDGDLKIWNLGETEAFRPIEIIDRSYWIHDAASLADGSLVTCRNMWGPAHWTRPDLGVRDFPYDRLIPCLGGEAILGVEPSGDIVLLPLEGDVPEGLTNPIYRGAPTLIMVDESGCHLLVLPPEQVLVIDLTTGERRTAPLAVRFAGFSAMCISPSASRVAYFDMDLGVVDMTTGETTKLIEGRSDYSAIGFAGNDSLLEAITDRLLVWNLIDGSQTEIWKGSPWEAVAIVGDGRAMVVRDEDLRVWWVDPSTGEERVLGRTPAGGMRAAAYHEGLGLVAVSGWWPEVSLYSLHTAEQWSLPVPGAERLYELAFDPDGRWLFTNTLPADPRLWRLPIEQPPDDAPLEVIRAHVASMTDAVVVRDEDALEGYAVTVR